MPQNVFLLDLLFKVATSLLAMIMRDGILSLFKQPPVRKAIEATCECFPHLDALSHSLSKWCGSKAFSQILEAIKNGSRDISKVQVVDSFIDEGGFYAGNDTKILAEEVLNTFAVKLEKQLLATDEGLYFHERHEEARHIQTLQQISELGGGVIEIKNTQREILQRLPPEGEHTRAEEEVAQHAKVDAARELLKQGQIRAARSILEELRKSGFPKPPSTDIQFRIATNLGSCALQFGENKIACKEFMAALAVQPESVKALANAGLAKLLLDQPKDALGFTVRARQVEGHDSHATSVHLLALHQLDRASEIDNLLRSEPWISDDPSCALMLSIIRYDQGEYEDAKKHARNSLRGGSADAQSYVLIAYSIITPAQVELIKDPPLAWRLPESLISRLLEADAALTSAIDILENHDNKAKLYDALVNRAATRAMLGLGHEDDALSDCNRVLYDIPTHEKALHNKGLLLVRLGKTCEAISVFESISPNAEIRIILGSAYVANKEPEKAISILQPHFQHEVHDDQQLDIADTLLAAYFTSGNEREADEVARLISEGWPNDSRALSAVARHRRRQGRTEESISLFRENLTYITGHRRDLIVLELADVYYMINRYNEAADLYSQIVDKTSNNPITRKYLVALFNAGSYRDALNLARILRGAEGAIPVVTEVEARIMEHIGDLDGAIDLLGKLSRIEPKNISHQVSIVFLRLRQGNRDGARELLSSIEPHDIEDSRILLQIAYARDVLGMPGVLPLAYRARRIDFGNPEVHLAYIGLFLSRESPDDPLLKVDKIAPDCVVHLQGSGVTQTWTVLDESGINRERGEIDPSDSLAQKLLGLRKGGRVVLRGGPLEELSYEIVDVQSKYVFAFQETLSKFSTWFPEHPGLYRVEVKGDDISKILLTLDARHRYTSKALALYREKHLPLGALARLVGSSLVDVWSGLANQADGVILASTGKPEDAKQEAALLANSHHIALDLTSLLTLAYLGFLDQLPVRFDTILLSQALIDDLDETLTRNIVGPPTAMTMWKEGEQYYRREITPADLQKGREFIENIKTFGREKCKIAPTIAMLEMGKTRFGNLKDVLGGSASAAILLAKEHGYPLYSDDLGLRAIANNDWQVSGFWTQSLLMDLRDKGLITGDQYHEAVNKLLFANYHFVSINADGLLLVLRNADFKASKEVVRIIRSLHGPVCSEESAIYALSDLVRRLWLEPLLDHQKLLLLDLVLNTLTTGRDPRRTLHRFKIALRERFALIPHVALPIYRSIDLWVQQKTLYGLPPIL